VVRSVGVDAITIVIAILATGLTSAARWLRGVKPIISRRRITNDLLNGSVIYPFVLLVVSVGNINVFNYLKDSRVSLALAGLVGIIFVVGELMASVSVLHDSHPDKG
jgi:hypothetical protein